MNDAQEKLYGCIKMLRGRIKYLKEHPGEIDNFEGMTKPYIESHNVRWLELELEQHEGVMDYSMRYGPTA